MYSTRLAYAHLKARQLEASVTFYSRFLDLQLVERFAQTALLVSSDNQDHFELALSQGEPAGPATLGFAVASAEDFALAKEFVRLEGVEHSLENRGIAEVLSLNDPDGNKVELFLDRRSAGGRAYWRGGS
jgi:catechol-2,3-dioxygenase